MKQAIPILLTLFCAAAPSECFAGTPLDRANCSVGFSSLSLDESSKIEPIEVIDVELGAGGGDGYFVSCEVTITSKLYLYAAHQKNDGSFDVGLSFDQEVKTASFDLKAERVGIGIGLAQPVSANAVFYTEIGYGDADYDYEQVFVVLDSGGAQFGPAKFNNDPDAGIELELGVEVSPSNRLIISGFAHYGENQKLKFDDQGGLSFRQRNADSVSFGLSGRYRLSDLLFLDTKLSVGDHEFANFGIGVSF